MFAEGVDFRDGRAGDHQVAIRSRPDRRRRNGRRLIGFSTIGRTAAADHVQRQRASFCASSSCRMACPPAPIRRSAWGARPESNGSRAPAPQDRRLGDNALQARAYLAASASRKGVRRLSQGDHATRQEFRSWRSSPMRNSALELDMTLKSLLDAGFGERMQKDVACDRAHSGRRCWCGAGRLGRHAGILPARRSAPPFPGFGKGGFRLVSHFLQGIRAQDAHVVGALERRGVGDRLAGSCCPASAGWTRTRAPPSMRQLVAHRLQVLDAVSAAGPRSSWPRCAPAIIALSTSSAVWTPPVMARSALICAVQDGHPVQPQQQLLTSRSAAGSAPPPAVSRSKSGW